MLCMFNLTTQSIIYNLSLVARNDQVSEQTIVALKPILGKILLDKDWLFFCLHVDAKTWHRGFCLSFSEAKCSIEDWFKILA